MDGRATPEARRKALLASYICAALAAGLLAAHFNAALFPTWTRGIALLSGGIAVAGTALAAYSLGSQGWTSLRHWAGHLAFAINAFLGVAFIVSASPD